MPSASAVTPPPVAVVASQMVSTMDRGTHLITTLQNDLSGAWKAMAQEIAQEAAYFHQQWDHLLGNVPAVQQAGSGSGNGAMTTVQNAQNQQLKTATQQAGSGSGSGAMTTAHNNTFTQRVMPLAGNGSGSGSGPVDIYTWDPGAGNGSGSGSGSGGTNYLASNYKNWLKNGVPQMTSGTVPGNESTDQVVFDATISDDPIEWDDPVEDSWNLKNGYNALQTIDTGDTIELKGTDNGTSLSMDANSWLNLAFASNTSKFQIDNNATITNMQLGGNSGAQFIINGGTTTIGSSSNYTDTIGVNFTINAGATVDDETFNTLTFSHDAVNINVYGEMDLHFTSTGGTLIDRRTFTQNYINVSGGTLKYTGTGGVTDTLNVPVAVVNGGSFILVNNQLQLGNAQLTVKGGSPNGTLNNSVYVQDAASTVQLTEMTLEADNDYYQANGTLETMDNNPSTLQDGATGMGKATIAGGAVIINQPNVGYGQLNVNAVTLNFSNAQLVVAISAKNPPTCDLLNVTGVTNLGNNAALKVYDNNGPPNPNLGPWVIIQDGQNNNIAGNFVMPITTVPQANLTAKVDPANPNRYILTS